MTKTFAQSVTNNATLVVPAEQIGVPTGQKVRIIQDLVKRLSYPDK